MIKRFIIYNDEVKIDLKNGRGFDKVINLMSGFLNSFSNWADKNSFLDDVDMKQEAYLAAIEGIFKYTDTSRGKLSTFLHTYVRNKMIDIKKKKRIFQVPLNEKITVKSISPEDRISAIRSIEMWDDKWREIIFRIVIKQDSLKSVAEDENITPWGLTRAIRRKLKNAKNNIERH